MQNEPSWFIFQVKKCENPPLAPKKPSDLHNCGKCFTWKNTDIHHQQSNGAKKKRIECSLLWLHNNSYCKIKKKPIHLSKDYIIVIEFCGINSGYHEAIWPKKRKWIFGVVVLMTVVFKKNNGVRRWWSVTDNDGGAISCLQVINCFPPDSWFGK